MLSDLVSTENLFLGSWMDVFLLCPHRAEGPKEFPEVSFIRAVILLCGEGNGTPLQYSCLENPMDGGAW